MRARNDWRILVRIQTNAREIRKTSRLTHVQACGTAPARAGTTTAYPWGNDIGKNNANCNGCGSQWDYKQTAPVGSFPPSKFGLYDLVGNVSEWTEDCYRFGYDRAPTDGSALIEGANCLSRVVRGGSWYGNPDSLRSAHRDGIISGIRYYYLGFRVARTWIRAESLKQARTCDLGRQHLAAA
jgi:hypothetical protein